MKLKYKSYFLIFTGTWVIAAFKKRKGIMCDQKDSFLMKNMITKIENAEEAVQSTFGYGNKKQKQ